MSQLTWDSKDNANYHAWNAPSFVVLLLCLWKTWYITHVRRLSLTSYTLLTPFFSQAQSLIRNDPQHYDPSAHEEEPPDMQPGITIQHLTKVYNQVRRTAAPVNIAKHFHKTFLHLVHHFYKHISMYLLRIGRLLERIGQTTQESMHLLRKTSMSSVKTFSYILETHN